MRDNIKLAFRSIRANKMRAMLTMLGIIIGIASVIAIMTIARSMNLAMEAQNAALGANNLSVNITTDYSNSSSEILSVPAASSTTTTNQNRYTQGYPDEALISIDIMHDFQTKFADRIAGISYTWDLGNGKVTLQHNTVGVDLNSANAQYLDVASFSKIKLEYGRWITREDVDKSRNVAVIPVKLANALFGGDKESLGKQIDITLSDPVKTITVTVVGVYKTQASTYGNALTGSFSFDPSDWGDPTVYIPITTALDVNSVSGITGFSIAGIAGVDFDKFKADIENYFKTNYKNSAYTVEVITPNDYQDDDTTMQTLENAFSVVAAISLIVGGIGVMNIMTVSVTERTREIGVRKALGAKRANIRLQFISESVVLSLMGGVLGVILGIILGNVAAGMMGYPATASPGSIFVSFGVSVFIGVFFGYYPANKAAKMNPIDALRYE